MSKLESLLYLLAFLGLLGNVILMFVLLGRGEVPVASLSLLGAFGCAWGMLQLEK